MTLRGNILNLTGEQRVARALSQVGRSVLYHLQYPNGGTDPNLPGPEDSETKGADCIGFAAWAHGFDRFQYVAGRRFPMYDGYINTDSMIEEGQSNRLSQPWFNLDQPPQPGDMIVAHTYRKKLPPFSNVIGHIGIITAVHRTVSLLGGKYLPQDLDVVHCSPSNYQYTNSKSAIWKTSAAIWMNYYPSYHFARLSPYYSNLYGKTPTS